MKKVADQHKSVNRDDVLYGIIEQMIEEAFDDLKDEVKGWASIQSQRAESSVNLNNTAEMRQLGSNKTIVFWNKHIKEYWVQWLRQWIRDLYTHELIHVLQANANRGMSEDEANKKMNFFKETA